MERLGEVFPHDWGGLCWARFEAQVVTGVVIEDPKGMATGTILEGEVTFEVDLPHVVRGGSLETLPHPRLGLCWLDAAPPSQDPGNRRRRRHIPMTLP